MDMHNVVEAYLSGHAHEYNLWGGGGHDDMFHVKDITDKYISLINIFI